MTQTSETSNAGTVEQEVRFAVALYGGVSLAIYINGVSQELLRLVRSTAKPVLRIENSTAPRSTAPQPAPHTRSWFPEALYMDLVCFIQRQNPNERLAVLKRRLVQSGRHASGQAGWLGERAVTKTIGKRWPPAAGNAGSGRSAGLYGLCAESRPGRPLPFSHLHVPEFIKNALAA